MSKKITSVTKEMNLADLKPNPKNPRYIRDDKLDKLKKSISDFPQMLEMRPLVADEDGVVLGGNMRFRALKALKIEKAPVTTVSGLTEEQKDEFVIKDNLSFGEFDWEDLANKWEETKLEDWGMSVFNTSFDPNLTPNAGGHDVTSKDVSKTEDKLNNAHNAQTQPTMDCLCPDCGFQFKVSNPCHDE